MVFQGKNTGLLSRRLGSWWFFILKERRRREIRESIERIYSECDFHSELSTTARAPGNKQSNKRIVINADYRGAP